MIQRPTIITFVVSIDYPNIGASGLRVCMMCKELRKNGFKTEILIPTPKNIIDENTPKQFYLDNIKIIWLYNNKNRTDKILKPIIKSRSFRKEIIKCINNGTTCFIQSQLDPAWTLSILNVAKKRNIPVISEHMDMVFDTYKGHFEVFQNLSLFEWFKRVLYFRGLNPLKNYLMKKIYQKSDILWLISTNLIEEAKQIVNEDKILKVPPILSDVSEINTTEINEFIKEQKINFDAFNITFAGNLIWHQGFDILLYAFHKFLDEVPTANLICAGNFKDNQSYVFDIIKKLSLKDKIIFTDYLKKSDINTLYKMSDVLVAPQKDSLISNFGFSTKVVDYVSSGTISIASRVGEQSLVLKDNKHLLLFNPSDENDLLNKLLFVYKNKILSKQIEKEGQKFVLNNFNSSEVMKKPIKKIKEIMQKNRCK